MTQLQKLFLLLVLSYLVVKVIIMVIMYFVTKRVQQKGEEYKRKRALIKSKEDEQ